MMDPFPDHRRASGSAIEQVMMNYSNDADVPTNSKNPCGAKSDLALRSEHGHELGSGKSAITSPSLSSLQAPNLPSLPTPEQRKKLLYQNIKGLKHTPQYQKNYKNEFTGRWSKSEKWKRRQQHQSVVSSNLGAVAEKIHQTKNENMSTHAISQRPRVFRPGPPQNFSHHNNRIASQARGSSSSPVGVPPRHGSRGSQQPQAVARLPDDWNTWVELSIRLHGLPPGTKTRDLWKAFIKQGSVNTIELSEDGRGNRDGKGFIRFRPPPLKPIWMGNPFPLFVDKVGNVNIQLELLQPRRIFMVPSPVDPQIQYPESMMIKAESLDFGFMNDAKTMVSKFKTVSTPQNEIVFRQEMRRGELVIEFPLKLLDPRPSTDHPEVIHRVGNDENKTTLVISMETPPKFYRERHDVIPPEEKGRYWTQNDAWFRQTDIVYDRNQLQTLPLALQKEQPIIDIGRWTTYCIVLDTTKITKTRFNLMSDAFRDHNVDIKDFPDFKLITGQEEPAIWEYLNEPFLKLSKARTVLEDLMMEHTRHSLPFPVRYQLEVCISHGCLRENNMSKDFVDQLTKMDPIKAQDVLDFVAKQKKRIYDPMDIFQMDVIDSLSARPKIPHYCVYIRSATITPSIMYLNTPSVETSNRVVRQYSDYSDRFLRVRFTDEKFEGRINSTGKDTENEVFTRIYRTMKNGIVIGDRHYEFLAFGNSQFREHGAYFFAPLPHLSAQDIRSWMGSFDKIKVIAKYAARLGQCFSTTRAIKGMKATVVEIQDIERNGFCFTDGVGKISPFLSQLVALELGITCSTPEPPSAFQFRLGGCKGVLAVCPTAKPREIHIRPSQYKFPAIHEGLEIIRWSQFATASLNRQLILVLSALGVSDEVFMRKLKTQLSNLEQAMTDSRMALGLLQKDIDANQMTLQVANMINDGFHTANEPFVTSCLLLWRAWSIKYLKEKAKITVGDGALLLGVIDETGILKGHFKKTTPETDLTRGELPEIFVQVSRGPDNKPVVVEGPMLLGRNPSLHPGDFRVVRGIDVPKLHHMIDVVVFPQTGDRDISSMCSGGDLDGDDYLVMWDKELLPRDWNEEPMDYKAPEPMQVEGEVTTEDITRFFVNYIRNDTLPQIAHAHLALGDSSEDGIRDEKCLQLATLHSMAVDYVKTGEPAEMRHDLKPRKWPHFMEKRHKSKEQIYVSEKVLGKLYDMVERVDFVPAFSAPFDKRVLDAYDLSEDLLRSAEDVKIQYDAAMLRIMAQHEIRTEFEVWTTFVLHHVGDTKDFKFHEVIGELSNALKYQFREACYKKAGGKEYEHVAPFVAAMYKVTSDQVAEAIRECHQVKMVGGQETRVRKMVAANMPLMSFPWLFQSILGMIAQSIEIRPGQQDDTYTKGHRRPKHKKEHTDPLSSEDDILETHEGFTHRGEVLELFENPDITPEVKPDPYASLDFFGQPEEPSVALEIKLQPELPSSAPPAKGYHAGDLLGIFGDADDPKVEPETKPSSKPNSTIQGRAEPPELSKKTDEPAIALEVEANHSGDLLDVLGDAEELSLAPIFKPNSFGNPGIQRRVEVLEPSKETGKLSHALEANTSPNGDIFDLLGSLDEPPIPKGVGTSSPVHHHKLLNPLEIPGKPSTSPRVGTSHNSRHHGELIDLFENPEKSSFRLDAGMNPDICDITSHHDDVVELFNNLDESPIASALEEHGLKHGSRFEIAPEAPHASSKRLSNGTAAAEAKRGSSHTNGVNGVKEGGDLAGLFPANGADDDGGGSEDDFGVEEVQLFLDPSRAELHSRLDTFMS